MGNADTDVGIEKNTQVEREAKSIRQGYTQIDIHTFAVTSQQR